MTTNIQVYNRFSSRINGEHHQGGTVERPYELQTSEEVYDKTTTIANAANSVVYNTSLATFKFLYIVSDYDLRLKLTDTNSNTFSINIKGSGTTGKFGLPFQLGADETTDASNTLVTVQAFNTSGNTAKVRVFAST